MSNYEFKNPLIPNTTFKESGIYYEGYDGTEYQLMSANDYENLANNTRVFYEEHKEEISIIFYAMVKSGYPTFIAIGTKGLLIQTLDQAAHSGTLKPLINSLLGSVLGTGDVTNDLFVDDFIKNTTDFIYEKLNILKEPQELYEIFTKLPSILSSEGRVLPPYLTGEEDLKNLKDIFNTSTTAQVIRRDPLVLDLDGDGLEIDPLGNGAHFDLDRNGFAEETAWVNKDDGLLVLDRNGDGIINDGGELFGDQTTLADGTIATSGFEALAEMDTNGDGIISSEDAGFKDLRIWQDSNSDGFTDEGELKTLEEAGITAIDLENQVVNKDIAGNNTVVREGIFIKEDGTLGNVGELLFERDTLNTEGNEIRENEDEIMENHFRTDDPVPIIGANIGKNYLYLDLALDPHGIQGFYSMLTETPILIKDSLQSLDDVKNLISDFILTLINIFHIIGIKYSTFASYSPRANYSFISAELTRFNGHSRRI